MSTHTRSFDYTRGVLRTLTQQARDEVRRLGGNRAVEVILDRLEVGEKEGEEPVLETSAAEAVTRRKDQGVEQPRV